MALAEWDSMLLQAGMAEFFLDRQSCKGRPRHCIALRLVVFFRPTIRGSFTFRWGD
jgi:hypothetical protein